MTNSQALILSILLAFLVVAVLLLLPTVFWLVRSDIQELREELESLRPSSYSYQVDGYTDPWTIQAQFDELTEKYKQGY